MPLTELAVVGLAAEGRDEVSLVFRNVFVGTHLICNYKKGSATFKSDNPSALAILKDVSISLLAPTACWTSRVPLVVTTTHCTMRSCVRAADHHNECNQPQGPPFHNR